MFWNLFLLQVQRLGLNYGRPIRDHLSSKCIGLNSWTSSRLKRSSSREQFRCLKSRPDLAQPEYECSSQCHLIIMTGLIHFRVEDLVYKSIMILSEKYPPRVCRSSKFSSCLRHVCRCSSFARHWPLLAMRIWFLVSRKTISLFWPQDRMVTLLPVRPVSRPIAFLCYPVMI